MEEIINSGKEFPLVSDGDDEYDNNDRHSPLAPLIAQIITAHLNKLPEYQEAFQAIKTLHYSSAQIPKPSAENKITAASKTQILMDYYLNLKDAKTLEELEQIQLNFKTKKEYNILEQHRNPFGSGKTKSIMATETIYSTIRQEIEQKQKQLQLQEKIIDHSEKMLSFFNNKKECVDKIRQYHEFGEIVSLVFNDPLQREASRDKKRTKSQY
jgi:hypothetical protein